MKTENLKKLLQSTYCKLPTVKLLTFLLLTVYCQLTIAQIYPVQVTPQLVPPYSLNLSEYQTTSAEKLFVNLLLTDTQEIGRQVRLKMYIEGKGLNIQSLDFVAGATPIFLDGGINQRLSNLDLRPYFNLNNLLGIAPQQYNQPLPDGRYNFCFEVYDQFSGQKLSRKSCFSVYLILNDPPFLNVPNRGDLVTAQNPQNILFNWTPRHLNATGVQYEFTIKELWDTGLDPQAAFLASPPLHQETTFASTLLYGPAKIQLLEGKTYGWQVRALVSDGISETSVFRNNGYSEIYHFVYTGNCDVPGFILSEAKDSETVVITWAFSDHLRYEIQYRKKGYEDEDWFNLYAYNQESTIQNLEAGTVYEFRVGGECTQNGGFAFSQIYEFTTPTEDETAYYNCGIPPEINITNKAPLPKINAGETFMAADFPVVIEEVSGSSGNFSGWGYITIPFLEKLKTLIDLVNEASKGKVNIGKYTRIKVLFNNVGINTDYKLISGFVETAYDPDWKSIIDLDKIKDELFGKDGDVDTFDATNINIDAIKIDVNGKVILIDSDGVEHPIEVSPPVTIKGANDEQWEIDKDGKVTQKNAAEGGTPNKGNTNGVNNNGDVTEITSTDVSVLFTPNGFYSNDLLNQNITDNSYTKKYETIPQANGGEYNVLYKTVSNAPLAVDKITAEATFSNGKDTTDIVFKTKQGTAVPVTWSGNTATLTLKKQFVFAKVDILATVKPTDSTEKYDVAGKLNLWHIQQKSVNVTVVPLNNASISPDLTTKLNAIYNKAGVDFIVTKAPALTVPKSVWDKENNNDKLDIGDSNILSNYTEEERAIYTYYKEQRGIKEKMYYVFLTGDIPTSNTNINGFMPLKRQYGFVFNKPDPAKQVHTLAHELGHGVFGLQHYEDANATELLMYKNSENGELLTHMDWQKLHEPGVQLYIFQGDEAGEQVTVSNMEYLDSFKNTDGTFTFISLSGKPITLPTTTSSITFSTGDDLNLANCKDDFKIEAFGTLRGFTIEGVDYSYCGVCNSNNFTGYTKKGTGCAEESKYLDIFSKQNYKNAIVGLPCILENDVVFKVMLLYDYFKDFNFSTIDNTTYKAKGEFKPYDYVIDDFNYVIDENVVYVPAQFNPVFDEDVKKFLKNEYCFCSEDDFTNVAYGFIYATQLQKNKEFFSCFTNGVPLFFYDENINSDKLHHVVVQDWENKNINGFNTLKKDINKFKTLSASFNDHVSLYNFLKKYTPEELSGSNANSYSLRFGTAYWESGFVLDKIQNISDNELLKQHDDVFCLWESIPITDRISAINRIADEDITDAFNRTEEIVLYLIINAPDKEGMIKKLKETNYSLFWKVWGVLDKAQRAIFISYLNQNLINETTKNAGNTVFETFKTECENATDPCNLNDYKVLPIFRANALNVVESSFDVETNTSTDSFKYNLETFKNGSEINISLKLDSQFLELDGFNYLSLADHPGDPLDYIFFSNLKPFDPIVLMIKEDINLNGEVIVEKDKVLTVPVIFLHWLDSSIDSEQNQIVFRIAADGLVVATIVASGGATTPLLALDLAIFGTDFVFQIVNETSESIDPEINEIWESIYTLYNIANMPRAVMSAGNFAVNGTNKLFTFIENSTNANRFSKLIVKPQYLDDFLINNSSIKIEEAIIDLDRFILAIKNTPRLSSQALIPKSLYRNLIDLRLRLANATFNAPAISAEIQASSQAFTPYLKIVNNNTSATAVANVVIESGATTPLLTNVRWLSNSNLTVQETNTVGTLKDIGFVENGIHKTGTLDIVEDATNLGQFYLKTNKVVNLEKVISKTNLLDVLWTNNITGYKSSHNALDFWKNTTKEFEHLIKENFYLKYDKQTGNLLFGNHKTKQILGFYEGLNNIKVINEKGLSGILSKLKGYHGQCTGGTCINLNVSSGAVIISNPEKTATIVGNYVRYPWYQGDMKQLIPEVIGDLKTQQFGPKKGGFNVLNIADEKVLDWKNFWEEFNKPWLEAAIKRGDDIWAASDPTDLKLLFKNLDEVPEYALKTSEDIACFLTSISDSRVLNSLTGFGKEVQLLFEKGYKYSSNIKRFIK